MDPLNLSNGGDFLRTGILKESIKLQKEKRKFVVVCSSPPGKSSIKRLIRRIHIVVVTSKKCTKKCDMCRCAELLFCSLNKLFLEIVVVVVVVVKHPSKVFWTPKGNAF